MFPSTVKSFQKQDMVVSKSGNPGPGPVPNSYFLYYIFIKALILIIITLFRNYKFQ
jgi:hypothetical protein